VATIVMRGRQHLAALIADERIIMLELLRYAHEIKAVEELGVDELLEAPEVRDKEVELAEQLVAALDEPWSPEQFRDQYRDDLLDLIEEKARTGSAPARHTPERERSGEVVDMMELLKRSVGEAKGRKSEKAGKDGKPKTQRRKAS
jgi:DNA end-binding protein Ku